jgi:hypothetical protein
VFAEAPLAGETVAEPHDRAALAVAITRVLRQQWDARSAAARRIAEAHPWERHLDELEAFLGDVARGAGR